MSEKKRSLSQEQMKTAERICEQLGIDLENKGGVFTLYKSVSNAKRRTGRKKGYENIEFLLGDTLKQATINLIGNPALWFVWGELQKDYEKSGYDPDLRPSLHRINNNGHYQNDNLAAVPVGEHNLEHAQRTMLFAIDSKGGIRLGGFESKIDAKKQLKIADKTLNKMIDGDYYYTNQDDESMTFLQLEPSNEPAPVITKEQQEEFNRHSYQYLQHLKQLQLVEPTERRAKVIKTLSRTLVHYESKLQAMN